MLSALCSFLQRFFGEESDSLSLGSDILAVEKRLRPGFDSHIHRHKGRYFLQPSAYYRLHIVLSLFLGQYVGQLFGGEYQRIRRQRCVARPHNPVQLPSFGDIYGHCYSNIARINIYLDRLDQFIEDKTNADYKQLRGEAVGLRGLLYYYLYVCFGEVPVTKRGYYRRDYVQRQV